MNESDLTVAGALCDLIHSVAHEAVGECPEVGGVTLCWEVAAALLADGWRPPLDVVEK